MDEKSNPAMHGAAGDWSGQSSAHVINQGSGMLLATGTAEMLVTCGHVYDRFVELREKDSTTRLAMSGAEGREFIDISTATVLGKDSDADLATLAIPRFDANLAGKVHAHFPGWPLRRAERGMMGYLIGYPGQLTIVTKESASKPLMEFARPVVSVSDRHFVLHDESGDLVQTYADNTPNVTQLSGISGCAVWIYDKGSSVPEFFLGGFAYQATASIQYSSPMPIISTPMGVSDERGVLDYRSAASSPVALTLALYAVTPRLRFHNPLLLQHPSCFDSLSDDRQSVLRAFDNLLAC